MLLEDRSDTWSVDAMPSDEEDNAARGRGTANSNVDDLDERDLLGDGDTLTQDYGGLLFGKVRYITCSGGAMYGDAVNDEDLEAMLASGAFDDVPASAAQASSSLSAAVVPQAGPSKGRAVTRSTGTHVTRNHKQHEMSSKRKAINLFQELQKVCYCTSIQ